MTGHTATGPAGAAAPVRATLDVAIYRGSTSAPAICGDGLGVSDGTTTSGSTTTIGVTAPSGGVTGVITAAIYGD